MVQVKVYTTLGALVYSGSNVFSGKHSELRLPELTPGLYHLVLQDRQGRAFRLPFVKQ